MGDASVSVPLFDRRCTATTPTWNPRFGDLYMVWVCTGGFVSLVRFLLRFLYNCNLHISLLFLDFQILHNQKLNFLGLSSRRTL